MRHRDEDASAGDVVAENRRLAAENARLRRLVAEAEQGEVQRRRAEARLRETEEFTRRVLASSADCIKVLDLDANLEFMSEGALCAMEVEDFGAIRGRCWPDFWSGEERARVLAAVAEAKRGGTGRFQGFAPTAKGSPRWWDVVVTAIHGADGRPEKLLSISRDVTATRLVEERVRESETRLQFMSALDDALLASRDAPGAMVVAAELLARRLDASRCAYADVDTDAENDLFVIRNDWTAPGIASSAGTYSLDLFGPRAASDMHAGRTLVIADVAGELAPDEGRDMFQAIGIAAIVCCPLVKDGRLVAMMAVHQDRPRPWRPDEISLVQSVVERCWAHVQRVGAEARLRESEERLRLATEHAEIGFWDVDVVHDRLIWPVRTKAMFGISPDVPVSLRDFFEGVHPDDLAATSAAFAAAADPGRRALYDVEYRVIGKEDGVVRWIAAKGRGVFDAAGHCVRMVGTVVDITARKAIEERLRELNDTLERRVHEEVAERTRTEDALRQAQKMEAVGQLTGGIAHDFNNLLAGIVGSLDLMQARIRQGRTGELPRYVQAAMASAQRAAALTHRLLAFSRRQPLDPKPVDANRLLAAMEELLRRTLGPQVDLTIHTAAGLWPTLCDPHQLENALLNLAINARDAMPEGGTLTIETTNAELDGADGAAPGAEGVPGPYVAIRVVDTGTGMTPEVIARAFDPFFTTKPIGQGTGLGLSMVYGFVRQSLGHVRIQSEEGRGTTVTLYLPPARGGAAEGEESQASGEPPRAGAAETVLVVDDEPVVRGIVVDVLAELGYRTLEAEDGPEALTLLRDPRQPIDLLVTDVGLPNGINGRQLADEAREHRRDLKVLFITGYAETAALAGFAEQGMAMMTKPFAVDALARKVRDMLQAERGSQGA